MGEDGWEGRGGRGGEEREEEGKEENIKRYTCLCCCVCACMCVCLHMSMRHVLCVCASRAHPTSRLWTCGVLIGVGIVDLQVKPHVSWAGGVARLGWVEGQGVWQGLG